ncbi:MAG: AgmX/PglI C-terminal domain-containing protein [Polyangiaceae bacterium]
MTAAMRAVQPTSGPKVLRIGLVVGGRIVEERIVKQRTSVTVGRGERSTFVVQASLPPQFKLFERLGGDYCLNFVDGMSGRLSLATGITDLVTSRGHARRLGSVHQLRLTEEARGKVVIGDTTFLFQFVPAPLAQQRPRLPLSVKGGVASQIDWRLAVIAAFSFLAHFGVVGAMYSDWTDPVVDDDMTAGLIQMARNVEPPLIVDTQPTATATSPDTPPTPTTKTVTTPAQPQSPTQGQPPNAHQVSALVDQVEHTTIAILTALNAVGSGLETAMSNSNVAPVDLTTLANKPDGVQNGPGDELHLLRGGEAFRPGAGCVGLQCVHLTTTAVASNAMDKPPTQVIPKFEMPYQPPILDGRIANAEAVIRSQIHPGARRCYQKGLESDPNQAGRLVILIKIAASGEVDSASAAGNSGLSAQVASCIEGVAKRARFDSPGEHGSTMGVPFNFVRQ